MSNFRFPFRIVLIVAVLGLIVSEIAMRFLLNGEDRFLPAISEEFQPLYQPNTYGLIRANLDLKNSPLSDGPSVDISTNNYGMRMGDVSVTKKDGVVRIAVMGGSTAFGWNLTRESTFPTVLETVLKQESKRQYETLNFAAPGFTSHHALRQYERLIHNFQPDVLILTFGEDDGREVRLSEKESASILQNYGLNEESEGLFASLKRMSALGRWLDLRRCSAAFAEAGQLAESRTQEGTWTPRVTPDDLKANLTAIIKHHQLQKGKTILVHTNTLNYFSAQPLEELAKQFEIPLLDIHQVFDRLGGMEERAKSFELGLKPAGLDISPPENASSMLFRVFASSPQTSSAVFIVGDCPELGDGKPNTIQMYDDETHGDEQAGDRVWSFEFEMLQPRTIHFAYTTGGPKGHWGDDRKGMAHVAKNQAPFYRTELPETMSAFFWRSPVYRIGQVPYAYLVQKNAPEFPNALGHQAIAKRLARLVRDAVEK